MKSEELSIFEHTKTMYFRIKKIYYSFSFNFVFAGKYKGTFFFIEIKGNLMCE